MSTARRIWVLTVLCSGVGLVMGTLTGLYAAAPSIAAAVGADQTELTWIVDAYTLAIAGMLLPAGAISDRFGRREVMIAGLGLFVLASVAALLVDSPGGLIACRTVLGIGAAFILPSTLSLITSTFPADFRDTGVSIWTAAFTTAGGFGILLTAALLEFFSWRSSLWEVLIAGLAVFAASWTVPTSKDERPPRLDVAGAITAAVSITALVYGLIEAGLKGWTSPVIIGAFVVGFAFAGIFVALQLRGRQPLLDVRLFAIRPFGASAYTVTMCFAAVYGLMFLGFQYQQFVLGFSAIQSALPIAAMAIPAVPISIASTWLTRRFGLRVLLSLGCLICAGAFVVIRQAEVGSGQAIVFVALVVLATGTAFNMAPATSAIISTVPAEKQGVAAAVNHTTREIGTALGVALFGGVLSASYSGGVRAITADLPDPAREASRSSIVGALAVADQSGPSGAPLAQAAQQAFVSGVQDAATVMIVVMVAAAVLSFCWTPSRSRTATDVPRSAEIGHTPIHHNTTIGRVHMSSQSYTVSGTVTSADGAPLVGSGVTLTNPDGRQISRAHTDDQGRYQVNSLQPGNHLVICTAAGLPPHAALVALEGADTHHDVVMAGSGTLVGLIRAGAQPIPGATITLIDDTASVLDSTSSGADGRYRFEGLIAGRYTLTANAPGAHPAATTVDIPPSGHVEHELELAVAHYLAGVVRAADTGLPIAGALATLVDGAGNTVATAETDTDGRYRFDDLPPSDYTLTTVVYREVSTTIRIPETTSIDPVIPWHRADPATNGSHVPDRSTGAAPS